MENKIKKMIRLWKLLICYSFTLVLVGCENVRNGQLGTQPKSNKEEITPTFLPGNTKKVKSQKNINIITLLMMLGLLSAQLTPVGSEPMHNSMTSTPNHMVKIKKIEEMRTLLYKRFSTFLFATKDVATTTGCSLEASNSSIILEKCKNDCTNRLNKLLGNEKIQELMKSYNSTSNNNPNPIVLYKIKKHNNNKDNYPNVTYTYTKNNTVYLYGWRNANELSSYQSIPDEIKKIWNETNDNKKDRIKQLEELVARLMTIETNSTLNGTLSKWCNEKYQDAAMGLIEAIEQIVDLIEIEEKLQNLENISNNKAKSCDKKSIIRESTELIHQKNLWKKLFCTSYKNKIFDYQRNKIEALVKDKCNEENTQFSKSDQNGQRARRKKRQIEERLTQRSKQRSKQNWRNSFLPHNTKQ